jgi:geranylgeranyl diphosphate synthase, type II
VAVECFHKASLVHDDIEDQDSLRYGRETLHEEQGVPVALNVGDLLVGEGYRLIAEAEAPAEVKARLLYAAASGHRSLCLGQGAELAWARTPEPLSLRQVLEIFRRKTSPAFQVALSMGALFAEAGPEVLPVLERYSESLGIAYQIRDDLKDSADGAESDDVSAVRLSLLLAIAHEMARGEQKDQVASWWMRPHRMNGDAEAAREMYRELGVDLRAEEILESYKEDAIRSLMELDNANLKGLLRRVVGKIFGDLEIKGWCSEFEARNAAGRAAGADSAA